MIIRKILESDRESVEKMMRVFYASDAVSTNGSPEIFRADIDACINDCPYLEGYVFEKDGITIGYGMLAKSFSTEFGKSCIWIEDLYLMEEYRGMGFGSNFLRFVESIYPDSLLRLEVEEENSVAVSAYKKNGFESLPYLEMKK